MRPARPDANERRAERREKKHSITRPGGKKDNTPPSTPGHTGRSGSEGSTPSRPTTKKGLFHSLCRAPHPQRRDRPAFSSEKMTLELTEARFALLARATRRIAEFCEKSPITADLLGLEAPDRKALQQIANQITTQLQDQYRKKLAP